MPSLKERRIQFDMVQSFKINHEIDRVEFVEDRGTRLSVDPLDIKSKLSNTEMRKDFSLIVQFNNGTT